jgi:DNA-binding NtrC family response regulator
VEVQAQTSSAILLVSDDVLVRNLLYRALSCGSHRVFAAANSAEAFHLASSLRGRIRLLVSVLEGACLECARRLTAEFPIRAVVACPATLALLKEAATVNLCDRTPSQISDLLDIVERTLSEPQVAASLVIA